MKLWTQIKYAREKTLALTINTCIQSRLLFNYREMRFRWFFLIHRRSFSHGAWKMAFWLNVRKRHFSTKIAFAFAVRHNIRYSFYLNFVHLKLFGLKYNRRTFKQNFSDVIYERASQMSERRKSLYLHCRSLSARISLSLYRNWYCVIMYFLDMYSLVTTQICFVYW